MAGAVVERNRACTCREQTGLLAAFGKESLEAPRERERRERPPPTAWARRAARGPFPAPVEGPIVRWPSKTEETEGLETNLSSGWVEQEE